MGKKHIRTVGSIIVNELLIPIGLTVDYFCMQFGISEDHLDDVLLGKEKLDDKTKNIICDKFGIDSNYLNCKDQ